MELDSNVRRVSHGTALLGGSPFRLIRLSEAGARMLDSWLVGDAGELSDQGRQLQARLVQAGMIHPVVEVAQPLPSVAFVVPVYGDPQGLSALLAALRREDVKAPIIVVDDASTDVAEIAAVAERGGAELISHDVNRGPGAARNTGWRAVAEDIQVVFFVDADVIPDLGSLARVLAHLAADQCAAGAPRVLAEAGPEHRSRRKALLRGLTPEKRWGSESALIASYEGMESPLDLGDQPGLVRVGARISYVPSAALAVRRSALVAAGGFDESMRFGEDVDLIWRLASNHENLIRYEPVAQVRHRNRKTVRDLLRQRFGYGSSAAPLAEHHGDAVTPLRLPLVMFAGWMAALFGGRLGLLAGLAGNAVSAMRLSKRLESSVDEPGQEAFRLMGQANFGVAGGLVNAANRNYAPLLLLTGPTRRALVAGAVIPPTLAWLRARPAHNLVSHIVLKALDNSAYCAGVWAGAWRKRSLAALLPVMDLPKKQHD